MERRCRQGSISLSQPHSTTPHPSLVGVPTRLLDALGCCPSAAGGEGATLSRFPQVPLTREPTCKQAIDPGTSGSTLTPADTSRPSRSSAHLPDFPWPGSAWLAHGSPVHGDWFPNPTGLLFCFPRLPPFAGSQPCDRPFPCAMSRHPSWPILRARAFPFPLGCCAALATRPSLSRPLFPSSRVYTPAGRQQPCGAGPSDPHPSRGPFRAPSTGRSLPAPVPVPCATSRGPITSYSPRPAPSHSPGAVVRP